MTVRYAAQENSNHNPTPSVSSSAAYTRLTRLIMRTLCGCSASTFRTSLWRMRESVFRWRASRSRVRRVAISACTSLSRPRPTMRRSRPFRTFKPAINTMPVWCCFVIMPSWSSVCWSIPAGHLTDLSRRVEVLDAKKQSLPAFPWCIFPGRMLYRFGYHYEHTPQSKHIRNNPLSFRMKLASFSLAKLAEGGYIRQQERTKGGEGRGTSRFDFLGNFRCIETTFKWGVTP